MDPNACLKAIRKLVKDIDKEEDTIKLAHMAEDMSCLIAGLDDWLTRGGFNPSAWTHSTKEIA